MERLEFGRVLDEIARRAETEAGRLAVLGLMPDPHAETLATAQALYAAAARSEPLGRLSLTGAVDLRPPLERARKGAMLGPLEHYAIHLTIGRGEALAEALKASQESLLESHFGRFAPPMGLHRAIGDAVTEEGAIKDTASPLLADIRRQIARLETEIEQVFQRLMESESWRQYLQEPLVTLRNGRRVVPVKLQNRRSVPGLVHDQSSSGQTVFVEPMAVVERQNRIQSLRADERDEIERILQELTVFVRQVEEPLLAMDRSIRRVDTLLAKVRWGRAMNAHLPQLGGDRLLLEGARHPLLERPVPISLAVGGETPLLVVSGPNTGGKTAALKCTGLMVLLALSGCPIPAEATSTVPLYRDVLADIGDEQSLAESLSTFAGHLRQLVPMVETAGPGILLLVDEVGAGTDPEEGAALAQAFLEHVLVRGADAMVTTHFVRLKLLAYEDPRVSNAQVEFDRETLSPTYRLVMGQPGSSQALYMAARLGLSGSVVERARVLVGGQAAHLEDVIHQLNTAERALTEQRAVIERSEAQVREAERALAARESQFEARRATERQRDRERLHQLEQSLRERAERLMGEVRSADRQERERALQDLRREIRSWGLADDLPTTAPPVGGGTPRGHDGLRTGDWVTGPRLPASAQLVEVDPDADSAMVAVGPVRMRVTLSELIPAANPDQPSRRTASRGAARALPVEWDLRGMTVAEALLELDRYLDAAVLSGMPMARIIHGKGTGALRRAVQESLRDHADVTGFRLGEAGEGGDGVTVVRFDGG